jgi:3'-5' exonuclease
MLHQKKETARLARLANSSTGSSSAITSSSGSIGAATLDESTSTVSEDSTITSPHSSRKMKPLALGFDAEWRPAYVKGCSYKVSLVQLSTATSVLLIQLSEGSEARGILTPLRDLMISPEVRLVGVGITHDVKKLDADHGKCACVCWSVLCCVSCASIVSVFMLGACYEH